MTPFDTALSGSEENAERCRSAAGPRRWEHDQQPSMWPQIVNPLTSDRLRPECRKAPSSPSCTRRLRRCQRERLRHVRSPSRELAVACRRRGPAVLVRPSIRGARQRPHPMLSARRLSCNPVASGPISGTVCPHPVAGRAARTSSRRFDPTNRDSPALLVTRRFQDGPCGNHAGIEISPERDQ
jgi:hypothetical protein